MKIFEQSKRLFCTTVEEAAHALCEKNQLAQSRDLHAVINTCMKINEFSNKPQTYLATVRVVLRDSNMTAKTTVTADSLQQAKALLTRIFGEGNVLNINQEMAEDEEVTEGTKTLSPQELQVKSLADKAAQYQQQAKAMKARQQMAKAQQNLMKATSGFSASNKR